MSKKPTLWRYYPGYLAARWLCGLIRLLPENCVERLFSAASAVAYAVDAKHRKLALRNLDLAFGDTKSEKEKKAIARGAFRSLFFMAAEFILVPKVVGRINSRVQVVPNFDPVTRALADKRGVIFIISHFGNWEVLAHRGLSFCEQRVASVARPLKNPFINREIEKLRCLNGAVILRKKWVAREIIERLEHNWCVAILMDQYSGRNAPFVPFFGRPVSTTPAVARFAMRTGAAVIPAFGIRQRFGYHHLCMCDEVPVVNTGNKKADIIENCTRFNRVIEEWVRRYPDQWLWMHRRWRRKKAAWEP